MRPHSPPPPAVLFSPPSIRCSLLPQTDSSCDSLQCDARVVYRSTPPLGGLTEAKGVWGWGGWCRCSCSSVAKCTGKDINGGIHSEINIIEVGHIGRLLYSLSLDCSTAAATAVAVPFSLQPG